MSNNELAALMGKQELLLALSLLAPVLSACTDRNSEILAPTVAAAQREGKITSFVPRGLFTEPMFNLVAWNIGVFKKGFISPKECTIFSIDGGDSNATHFVTAKHCVRNISRGEVLGLINPWHDISIDLPVDKIKRHPTADVAVIWTQDVYPSFSHNIELAESPLQIGQEVLIAGYPSVADLDGSKVDYTGSFENTAFFDSDAILMTAYGKVTFLPESSDSGYITVTTTDYQPLASRHSGSPVFVIEDGKLVLAGVATDGYDTDTQGKTIIGVVGIEPIRDMLVALKQ